MKFNQNTKRFIHDNASENVCEMGAILSRGRWVNNIIAINSLNIPFYIWYFANSSLSCICYVPILVKLYSSNTNKKEVGPRLSIPESKVHWANVGSTWDWQDPGGPHVDHMNLAIWDIFSEIRYKWYASNMEIVNGRKTYPDTGWNMNSVLIWVMTSFKEIHIKWFIVTLHLYQW